MTQDILVVDDTRANLHLLVEMLTKRGYKVRPATNGHMALASAQADPPDLILLDIMMPDLDGYAVCKKLKSEPQTRDIPVIFISALDELFNKIKSFSVGGVDYITKPFQVEEVMARIKTHLALRKLQKDLEEKNEQLEQEIAERKRIEADLRTSQAELQALFTAMTDAIFVFNREGRYLKVNSYSGDLLYKPADELQGKTLHEVFPKSEADYFLAHIRQCLDTGQTVQLEYKLDVEEKVSWFDGRISFVSEDSVVFVTRDITERKAAEEKIKQQNDFLNNVIESLSNPFYVVNVEDYTVQMANSAAQAWGISDTNKCYTLSHQQSEPCSGPDHPCPLAHVSDTKEPVVLEHIHFDKFGEPRDVEVHGYPILNEQGEVVQMIEYVLDVTERKQAEEQLRKLSRVVEQSPNSIVITDLEGKIEFVNPAFCQTTGYTSEELMGNQPNILKSGEHSPEVYQELWQTIRGGNIWQGELISKGKGDHLFWEAITIAPIKDKRGQITHYLGIKEDVTERKEAEEALKKAHFELQARVEELSAINLIMQTMTLVADLQEALRTAAKTITLLLKASGCGILLLNKDRTQATVIADYTKNKEVDPIENITISLVEQPAASRVLATRQTLVITPAPNNTLLKPVWNIIKDRDIKSIMIVPLFTRGEIIGAITVSTIHSERIFDLEEIKLAETVAGQIAGAIDNAQLFAEEQKAKEAAESANAALTALNAVTSAVNNSLDLEADLEKALDIILTELNLDHGWIFLTEDNEQNLRLAAAQGLPDGFKQQERITSIEQCGCRRVLEAGDIECFFGDEDCLRLLSYQETYPQVSTQHLSLPIFAKQKIMGILNLGGKEVVALTSSHYEWLKTVARQIGNAIENAMLYQNVLGKAERLTALNRVSRVVSLFWHLDRVLPPLLSEVSQVLKMSLGLVVLRTEKGNERFRVRTQSGRWQSRPKFNKIAWHQLPILQVIEQTQAPLLILEMDDRIEPLLPLVKKENIQTILFLPLIVQKQLTGFIQLCSLNQGQIFETAEIELARTLTNQAAVAIEKARLYEATVTRYEEELKIAHQIQQNLLPRTVPQLPGIKIAGLCQAAYATGGDFFDYILLPNQQLGVVVGDVTGKSLPAAMVMALARNTIRSELVNLPHPARAMTAVNHWLSQDIRPGTFVAVVQALIDPHHRKMSFVNAGQTAALLVRKGQFQYLLPDEAIGLPLGIQPDLIYSQAEISLQKNDLLIFYTDGIVEAKNEKDEMFSFERLEAIIQKLSVASHPEQVIEKLVSEVRNFVGDVEQHDDITLVVVQIE